MLFIRRALLAFLLINLMSCTKSPTPTAKEIAETYCHAHRSECSGFLSSDSDASSLSDGGDAASTPDGGDAASTSEDDEWMLSARQRFLETILRASSAEYNRDPGIGLYLEFKMMPIRTRSGTVESFRIDYETYYVIDKLDEILSTYAQVRHAACSDPQGRIYRFVGFPHRVDSDRGVVCWLPSNTESLLSTNTEEFRTYTRPHRSRYTDLNAELYPASCGAAPNAQLPDLETCMARNAHPGSY